MGISNRLNKQELTGYLIDERLTITGDLIKESLGTGGILSVGERGIDGYSPKVTITYISGSESSTNLGYYIINITDADHPEESGGQDFIIDEVNSIDRIEFNPDYSLTIILTDGTEYTTPSLKGDKGDNGSYYEPYLDSEGNLIFVPSSSELETLNVGNVIGPQGPQGPQGETGPQGPPGPQGSTITSIEPIESSKSGEWFQTYGTIPGSSEEVPIGEPFEFSLGTII